MTAAISMPLVYTGKKFFHINRYLIAISGFASMAFGIFLVYHIGFVDGLFHFAGALDPAMNQHERRDIAIREIRLPQ